MPISAYLKAIRDKIGHDLVALTAVSISVFDEQNRLLVGRDSETGLWSLPGGGIDPNEHPADAAVRECFEETGLLVRPSEVIGVFGGPEFMVRYPNGDIAYYSTIAFRGVVIGGSHRPGDGEMSELRYCSRSECQTLDLSPSSRLISMKAFNWSGRPYFKFATWTPDINS